MHPFLSFHLAPEPATRSLAWRSTRSDEREATRPAPALSSTHTKSMTMILDPCCNDMAYFVETWRILYVSITHGTFYRRLMNILLNLFFASYHTNYTIFNGAFMKTYSELCARPYFVIFSIILTFL